MRVKPFDRFLVCLSILAFCGLSGTQSTLLIAAPPAANVRPLPEQVNEVLGLRASQVAALKIMWAQADRLSVEVPLDEEVSTLDLELHSVRSPDYRVEIDFGGGITGEVPAGPVRTYRGTVTGKPGSIVAAFEGDDGLHAKVVLADGNRFWVEPIAGRIAGAQRDLHAVYRNEDVIPSMGQCDAHDGMRKQPEMMEGAVSIAAAACGTGLCVAEVACDADVEFYLAYGSVPAVENRINAIINGLNVEYERDVDIRHVISHIVVRIAEPDPYTATSAQTLLNEFRNHWAANHTSVPRDTAELFTGKNIDGSTIGIAWIGAICGSYGYSVVQADCCGSLGCATDLSAHELGHNWNAGHCTCPGTTMNPSITCTNQFDPALTVPVITSFRDTRTCLSAGSGCMVNTDCDDANPCTADTCTSGSCFNTNTTGPCDDGLYCNGADSCSGGACSVHAGNPCPPPDGDANCAESCNESLNNCTGPDPAGSSCNDGLYCNGNDSCSNGSCSIHTGNPCPGADGDGNCRESCNETVDACTANDPDGSTCNDGNAATTADSCSTGICTGTPITVNCDDGNPCTIDTVSGTTCSHSPAPAGLICNDGLYCNGTDYCSNGVCAGHAGNPCPGPDGDSNCSESCNEAVDACTANDANGSLCNDGNSLTINDACSSGVCAGTPSSCNDNNPCTVDTLSGTSCVYTAASVGTPCSDGLYCNGTDSCSAGTCSVHAGNPCTGGAVCANVCNEAADNCYAPADTACTSDSNPCTNDVCNGSGSCAHPLKAAGTSCNDNLFCNGADTCSSAGVCVHAGNACPGPDGDVDCSESCDEATDTCSANDANGTSCGLGDTCQNGMCVTGSYCGDDICDGGETCASCPGDCGFANGVPCSSGLDCCSGRCKRGFCRAQGSTLSTD